MTDEPARVGNVLYPVPDVSAAVAFYRDGLGLNQVGCFRITTGTTE